MREMLEICFSGPVLPATILLMLVTAYWLFVIVGALGVDMLDFDLDMDGTADGLLGAGMAAFRFLNLGRIPFMLWISVFGLLYWLISMLWFYPSYATDTWTAVQVILRNMAIGVVGTKILTQPLLQLVDKTRTHSAYDFVGQLCVVSAEVDEKRGQVKLHTEASPALLNVRSRGETFVKGDVVKIVEFDPIQHIYFVQKADSEVEA